MVSAVVKNLFNALVPMKAHSERLPNKNWRLFCGKPLYHYIVETLLASPYVEGIYIDTDSEEIIQDVKKNFPKRLHIIKRPAILCGDLVPFHSILNYDLSQVDGEYFIQTHSTCPFLKTATVNKAIEQFLKNGDHDSLFGVHKMQVRFYDKNGKAINHDPNDHLLRTQYLDPLYEEGSNIYLFTRSAFMKCGRRICEKPILFEVSRLECLDIDTEEDFQFAQRVAKAEKWD